MSFFSPMVLPLHSVEYDITSVADDPRWHDLDYFHTISQFMFASRHGLLANGSSSQPMLDAFLTDDKIKSGEHLPHGPDPSPAACPQNGILGFLTPGPCQPGHHGGPSFPCFNKNDEDADGFFSFPDCLVGDELDSPSSSSSSSSSPTNSPRCFSQSSSSSSSQEGSSAPMILNYSHGRRLLINTKGILTCKQPSDGLHSFACGEGRTSCFAGSHDFDGRRSAPISSVRSSSSSPTGPSCSPIARSSSHPVSYATVPRRGPQKRSRAQSDSDVYKRHAKQQKESHSELDGSGSETESDEEREEEIEEPLPKKRNTRSSSVRKAITPKRIAITKPKLKGDSGMSCHQCKSLRETIELTYCTTAKTDPPKPNTSSFRNCRKKYCIKCLDKFYHETPLLNFHTDRMTPWRCPACREICCCAACRRKYDPEKAQRLAPVKHPRKKKSKSPKRKREDARSASASPMSEDDLDSPMSTPPTSPSSSGLRNDYPPRPAYQNNHSCVNFTFGMTSSSPSTDHQHHQFQSHQRWQQSRQMTFDIHEEDENDNKEDHCGSSLHNVARAWVEGRRNQQVTESDIPPPPPTAAESPIGRRMSSSKPQMNVSPYPTDAMQGVEFGASLW